MSEDEKGRGDSHRPGPETEQQPEYNAGPHSIEAERAVLGAILLDPSAISLVVPILSAEDFYSDKHQRIFRAMVGLAKRSAAIDIITLKEELNTGEAVDAAYLSWLLDGVPDIGNVEHYAGIVKKKATLRRLVRTGERLVRDVQAGDENAAATALAVLSLEAETNDGLPRVWAFKELYAAEIPRPAGIINRRIFCPGSVGLLAGAGGIGKSLLAKVMAGAVAQGRDIVMLPTTASNVLFLSEEMDEAEIHDRILQLFTPEEAEAIFDRVRFLCQSGICLDADAGMTRLRRIMEKSGSPPFSMIDALSDVKGGAKENDNDQMGAVLRRFRRVARDVGTAGLAVHHYGKPSEFKKGTDLVRGATAIRDVCADIITVSKSKKSRLVEFAKVRHGVEPNAFTFDIEGDGGEGPVRLVFGEADAGAGFEEAGYVIQTVREEGGRLDRQTTLGILKREKGWSENTAQKYIDEALTCPSLLRKTKSGKQVFYEVQ